MKPFHHPHPGRFVREYLGDVTVTEAAKQMHVHRVTLQKIVNEDAGISPDMAFRLAAFLGTSHQLWFNLQKNYEMHVTGNVERPPITPITRITGYSPDEVAEQPGSSARTKVTSAAKKEPA